MRRTRKTALAALATIGASALVLTGCAAAPEESEGGGGEALDFLPCVVSDEGGFDDKSFNQLSFEGMEQAADELGVEFKQVQSNSDADYAPNIENLVAEGCNLIVTVGFALAAATVEAAQANPDIEFAIIDDTADTDFDGTTDAENIKPILFDTAGAAFLAGYAAASYSETGVIGTYGGRPFPTVSIFMDGMAQGVEYFNTETGGAVQVLGWDRAAQDGTFIDSFSAGTESRAAADNLLAQNADVLLPVGGPIYQSAAEAIRDSGGSAVLIGCDADIFESDPANGEVMFTSILKGMKVATYEAVMASANDEFDATPYIGTLENDGVGIAPFHDFEGEVDGELQSTLDGLRQQIIDGEITVTSYLNEG